MSAFPDEAKSLPVVELLKAAVDRHPDRIAIRDTHLSLTYAELWRALAGWAERIRDATRPGELVGVLARASARFPVGMLACLAAGRPFVAIDPNNPPDWIARAVRRVRPALVLTYDAPADVVAQLADVVRVFDLSETLHASESWQPARMTPDEPACVLFTSGSTGDPKGVVNSQRNLLQRVSQSINAAQIGPDDRLLTLASPCTIVGVRDLLTALLAGASAFVLETPGAGAQDIHRIIREQRISILFSFPALLRSVVQDGREQASDQLRLVRIGGDTTLWSDIATLRRWVSPNAAIEIIYAATEAPMMQWFVGEPESGGDAVPIGRPLPGNDLTVVDEKGVGVPEGEVGELVVRSPYVALGTWSHGRCQLEGVEVDPADGTRRMWRTGDLVRVRPDGLFIRIGRKDRQIKIRGVRVELEGVEAAIRRHPAVRDVGVLDRVDRDGTPRLIAYVELHRGEPARRIGEVRQMMERTMPPHALPWRFYAAPQIPRLASSKLDVRALRALDQARCEAEAASREATPAAESSNSTQLESIVACAWCEVLGLARIEPHDDFFELGGDSLRAIALIARLEKKLDREIPLKVINLAPAFGAFCAALERRPAAMYSPLVIIKPGRGAVSLFCVHGAGGAVMELFALGRHITWPGEVIGIQARGLDRRESPRASVAAMANDYLAAIKARQPRGPYFLCGYSFGGLVALEMAQRLKSEGQEVAFIGLLDALPPGNHLFRLWAWAGYLRRELTRESPQQSQYRNRAVVRARRVALCALWASIAYRPRLYAGELTLFEPSDRDMGLPSSASRWSRYATAVHRVALPGGHLDMVTQPNSDVTAKQLSACLASLTSRGLSTPPLREPSDSWAQPIASSHQP